MVIWLIDSKRLGQSKIQHFLRIEYDWIETSNNIWEHMVGNQQPFPESFPESHMWLDIPLMKLRSCSFGNLDTQALIKPRMRSWAFWLGLGASQGIFHEWSFHNAIYTLGNWRCFGGICKWIKSYQISWFEIKGIYIRIYIYMCVFYRLVLTCSNPYPIFYKKRGQKHRKHRKQHITHELTL